MQIQDDITPFTLKEADPFAEEKPKTRKPGRKPSPEKRLRILEAAVELFTERDYHLVLMEHVAEKAGVGKGTIYRYFPTKENLFRELVHLAVDRASEVIHAPADSTEPALYRLRRAVAMTLEYFRRNEPLLAILYHEKIFRCCKEKEDLGKKRMVLQGYIVQLLAEGIVEGSIRADLEPALAAVMLMTSIRSTLRNFGAERTSEQLSAQIMKIFLEGSLTQEARDEALQAKPKHLENLASHEPLLDTETLNRLGPLGSLSEEEAKDSHA